MHSLHLPRNIVEQFLTPRKYLCFCIDTATLPAVRLMFGFIIALTWYNTIRNDPSSLGDLISAGCQQ